jgi:putative ABC transport system permease protein
MEWSVIAAALILVWVPVIGGKFLKVGIERELFFNSIRAMVQLIALGFVLEYLFKIDNPLFYLPLFLFMTLYSGYIAYKRVQFPYWRGVVVIGGVGLLLLPVLVGTGIITLAPNKFIPIMGMVLGHSLNTYTQGIERLKREIELNRELIESYISVGASLSDALKEPQREGVKASLIPINNALQTLGVVSIPGITTGMLMAGASPFQAITYQLAIVYMWVSVNFLSALGAVKMVEWEGRKRGLPLSFQPAGGGS